MASGLCGSWSARWTSESSGCSWRTGKPLIAENRMPMGIMPEATRELILAFAS